MIENPAITIDQDNAKDSIEAKYEEQQVRRVYNRINDYYEKLHKNSRTIKVLGRLSGRGPKLVNNAIKILTII
jgi:hypothetical protein